MSLLKLSDSSIKFKPLIKLTKKQMNYVEDIWHHATLTYNKLVPFDDCRYNDLDYTDKEILDIIITYGVRTPNWMDFNINKNLNDDDYYRCALNKLINN